MRRNTMGRWGCFILFLIWLAGARLWAYSDHRNREIDSMEVVLQRKDLPWRDRLLAHSELMWGYLQTDGPKSIAHAKAILELTEGAKTEGLIVRQDAFRLLGQHAYAVCLYDSALHCYQRSLEVTRQAEKSGSYTASEIDNLYSVLYGTIGNLYSIQGMTILAMDYYLKALPIFERNGWMESVSTLYYNVGEMYQEMGNQEESRKNFEKSLDAALQSGDSLCMSLARYGLATVLLNEGMSQEAVKMEEQSLGYYLNHAEEEAASLMNGYVLMAHIFWEGLKDMPQAQLYMDKALAISQGMDTDLADAFSTQAGLFLARKEWKQCIDWCMRSLEKNDQDPHHNIGVYKMLAEAYASVGNTDESTRYLDLLYSTMETMANEQHQRALSEMEVRYETQQKEAQIEQMQQRQRMMWWIGALVFLIMAILFVTMWRIGHQRRKVLAVESKLTGEREERQRLARDLHDRVSGMLTATRLTLEQNHNDEALHLLQQASAEVRMVAHHLMPDSLTRQGLEVALRDYCQALTGVTFVCLGTPRRLSEHMETLCYSVIHELINNALRHAKASKIQVQLMFDKESISAIVADNGKGFDADVTHTGTGLRNIRERISSVGGNFTLTSTISQGTEAHFEIYI